MRNLDELPLGTLLCGGLLVIACALFGWWSGAQAADSQPREVLLTASSFAFAPQEITLKKGQPVTLVITTADAPMGFHAPALGSRADVMPGQVARVQLTPMKTGRFGYDCDLYCGSGHGDMKGTIIVVD